MYSSYKSDSTRNIRLSYFYLPISLNLLKYRFEYKVVNVVFAYFFLHEEV